MRACVSPYSFHGCAVSKVELYNIICSFFNIIVSMFLFFVVKFRDSVAGILQNNFLKARRKFSKIISISERVGSDEADRLAQISNLALVAL